MNISIKNCFCKIADTEISTKAVLDCIDSNHDLIIFKNNQIISTDINDAIFWPEIQEALKKSIKLILSKQSTAYIILPHVEKIKDKFYKVIYLIKNSKIIKKVYQNDIPLHHRRIYEGKNTVNKTINIKIRNYDYTIQIGYLFDLFKRDYTQQINNYADINIYIDDSNFSIFHNKNISHRLEQISKETQKFHLLSTSLVSQSSSGFVYLNNDCIFNKGEMHSENLDNIQIEIEKINVKTKIKNILPSVYDALDKSKTPLIDMIRNDSDEIINHLAHALIARLKMINSNKVVLAFSGGLDSTMALVILKRAFSIADIPLINIICISMPCYGTSVRTKSNAKNLASSFGVDFREINIEKLATKALKIIGHNLETEDIAYENTQARIRTMIAMNMANMEGAIQVGTGDLSEIILGWCTYNGDHMSMYSLNSTLSKQQIRYILKNTTYINKEEKAIIEDIISTPVSPELKKPDKEGAISQQTELILAPYELIDFFIYHHLIRNKSIKQIYKLAVIIFKDKYNSKDLKKFLNLYIERFSKSQFKRNCAPDSASIGIFSASSTANLFLNSDMSYKNFNI